MARVIITNKLVSEIIKAFKGESVQVFELMHSLRDNPSKGKLLAQVGRIVVKELRYNNFRFYFITDGFKLKFLEPVELNDLLIKFVRMSDKKSQQKVIGEIKNILKI